MAYSNYSMPRRRREVGKSIISRGSSRAVFNLLKKLFCSSWKVGLLVAVVIVLFIRVISYNSFAPVRQAFVSAHHHFGPAFRGQDMSEGKLYTAGLASVGLALPKGVGGCVWDVGANDGVWNSNSYYLIHGRNFEAWLFEPDAETFLLLRKMYGKVDSKGAPLSPKVHLFNMGLGSKTDVMTLRVFPIGFENTIVEHKSNQFDNQVFQYSIAVTKADLLCKQQKEALAAGKCKIEGSDDTLTVLSIDIEGADGDVFMAAHEIGCHWDIVILEGTYNWEGFGYKFLLKSAYNSVHVLVESMSKFGK